MKQVTHFQAYDGCLFETEKECCEYERRLEKIAKIDADLTGRDPEDIYEWILANTKGFK